jgi:transcriptional regulator with XRE-family HTH domain
MSIGTKIYNLRVQKRWSQAELGYFVGVSQTSIGNWEQGKSIKHAYLKKLAEVLGITVDYLLNDVQLKIEKDIFDKKLISDFEITIKASKNLFDDLKKNGLYHKSNR